MAASVYIELHTSSAFSFLRAASLPEVLIDRAAMLGYPAVALLDRDGVSGAPRFHKAALAAGIKPLIGAELTIEPTGSGSREPGTGPDRPAGSQLPAHRSRRFLSPRVVRLSGRLAQSLPAAVADEAARAERRGRARAPGARRLHHRADRHARPAAARRRAVRRRRPARSHCRRLRPRTTPSWSCSATCSAIRKTTTTRWCAWPRRIACRCSRPAASASPRPEERPLFDVLTSIREHLPLMRAGRRLAANAERYFKPPAQMARLFADRPAAHPGDARSRRSPAVQHDRPRLSLSEDIRSPTARPRSRSCARSPRSARAIATGRFTIAPARRWRASST